MKKLMLLFAVSLILSACEKENKMTFNICKETNQRLVITTENFNNVYNYIGCHEFTTERIEIEAIDAGIFTIQYDNKFEIIEAKEGQVIRF